MARIKKPKGKHRAYPRVPHEAGCYRVLKILSVPPSVNSIWVRGKWGSYKSRNYCDWEKHNITLFTTKEALQLDRDVQITVKVVPGKGWRMNRDIDNILKPILDMLTLANVIKDDNSSIVKSVLVTISDLPIPEAHVVVEIIGTSVHGHSNGLQEIPNPQVKAPTSRSAKGNPKSKPRRGHSKGETLRSAP